MPSAASERRDGRGRGRSAPPRGTGTVGRSSDRTPYSGGRTSALNGKADGRAERTTFRQKSEARNTAPVSQPNNSWGSPDEEATIDAENTTELPLQQQQQQQQNFSREQHTVVTSDTKKLAWNAGGVSLAQKLKMAEEQKLAAAAAAARGIVQVS